MDEAGSGRNLKLIGGVLIGGRSSRMGAAKEELRRKDGQTQLQHAVSCLNPYCDEVLISAANDAEPRMLGCKVVRDPDAYRGPAMGIARMLQEIQGRRADGLLVLAVDLPSLEFGDLEPVVSAWHKQPGRITAATFDGTFPEPLVTIYPADYVDDLTAIATGQDRSITRWLEKTPHQTIPLRSDAGCDVDTPQQWQSFNQSIDDQLSDQDT